MENFLSNIATITCKAELAIYFLTIFMLVVFTNYEQKTENKLLKEVILATNSFLIMFAVVTCLVNIVVKGL